MTEKASAGVDRRSFLQGASALAAGVTTALGVDVLGAAPAGAAPAPRHRRPVTAPELVPVKDESTGLELIKLPRGFQYLTYGWTTDVMGDGIPTPSLHDGMAAFEVRGRGHHDDGDDRRGRGRKRIHIVRNHEQGSLSGAYAQGMTYDPMATGGTTTLVFDPDRGEFLDSWASLAGTIRNCAGGPTPWGSWLSCEETTLVNGELRHGYVFDVPAEGTATGEPIRGMGRFSHEATATDPRTNITYLTEDATPSGLYRFVPEHRHRPTGEGRLQMLAIGDAGYVTYQDAGPKDYGRVHWVDVPNPDPAPGETSCVQQGIANGGAQFERLEGAWYHDGRIYFASTSGGPFSGQVFTLETRGDRLKLIFSSPGPEVLDAPDNICVSPRGGMILCEDGGGVEYLHGLTARGEIFRFAENQAVLAGERGFTGNFSGSEWAGATFDPKDGDWLFVNLQSPGITFAITGPWRDLGL